MLGSSAGRLRFGRFELDCAAQNLLLDGHPVKIQPQPLRVLSVLIEHAGQVVTREQLRDQVWGESTFVEFDQGLNYSIRQIRLALRDDAANPTYIETLPKQGYRFISSVTGPEPEEVQHPIENAGADLAVDLRRGTYPAVAESALAPAARDTPRPPTWIWAAVLLVASAAGWMLLRPKPPGAARAVDYLPLTNFADSAVAPALSPDGRMLAFIRGENTFEGTRRSVRQASARWRSGSIDPRRPPGRKGRWSFRRMAAASRLRKAIAAGDTWTVPVLGGDPARLVAHASALSWIQPVPGQRRVMFSSMPGEGIHMGIFESTESRSELRTVYMPAWPNGMAHRSFLSPDGAACSSWKWIWAVGSRAAWFLSTAASAGTRVGPQPAQCTDAAWSPDGKWMYLSANTGDGYHIWRQRFPDGTPEQVTSGATEEQGLSFAPDGRSFVTSVGASQSTLWVHDAKGDRQITSEGFRVSSVVFRRRQDTLLSGSLARQPPFRQRRVMVRQLGDGAHHTTTAGLPDGTL